MESEGRLLFVHKPEFTPCPQPDEDIREWLLDGWDVFEHGITCCQAIRRKKDTGEIIEKIEEMEEQKKEEEESDLITLDMLFGGKRKEDTSAPKDTEEIEFFLADSNRIRSYVNWVHEREAWVKRQNIIKEIRKFFTKLEELELQREWKITRKKRGQLSFETEFATFDMEVPSRENLDALKKEIQELAPTQEWMKYVAADGKKGEEDKGRWETLIEQIKQTYQFAQKIIPEQYGKTIWFEQEKDKKEYLSILENIREIFKRKGKITKLDLFFHRSFRPVLQGVKINGAKIQSESDCDLILNSIELARQREECARYWDILLTPHRVPDFFSLDNLEPEKIASQWIPKMEYYISWYEMDRLSLMEKMKAANISVSILFATTTADSAFEEINKIFTSVKNNIPFIIRACQIELDLQKKEYEIEKRAKKGTQNMEMN